MNHIYQSAKRRIMMVLLLSLLFLLLGGCQGQMGANQAANLEIIATYGFDGEYIIGQDNPIHFVIKNNGPAVRGNIVIEIPHNSYQAGELLIPFDIESGVEKRIVEHIALKRVIESLDYKVTADNKTLLSASINNLKAIDPNRPVVGVVADSKDKYRAVQSIQLQKKFRDHYLSDYQTKHGEIALNDSQSAFVVYLDSLAAFNKDNALNIFDCIIVGDVSNLNFDQAVEKQLLRWLNNGGMMIVESGSHFSKTFNQLPNSLKQISDPTEQTLSVDLSAIAEPLVGEVNTIQGAVTRQQVNTLTIGDFTVGYLEKLGAGKLLTLSTSLSEGAMQNWNIKSFYLNLIIAQLQQEEQVVQNDFNPWDSYRFSESINYLPIKNELPINAIGWLLVVYVLCVGPLLYFILKKMDKRQLLWLIAPLLATGVIMVVYGIGKSSWGNRAISNELSMLRYDQANNTFYANTKLALFNNANRAIKLSWQGENLLVPLKDHYYYDDYEDVQNDKEIVYQRVLGSDSHYIDLKARLWQSTHVNGQKVIPLSSDQAITAVVKIDENGKKLIVNNHSPIDLQYAVFVNRGNIYHLNNIDAGKSITVEVESLENFDSQGHQNFRYDSELTNENFFYSFIQDYRYEMNRLAESAIVAFSDKPVGYDVLINDAEPKVYSRSVVLINSQNEIAKGTAIELGNFEIDKRVYTLNDGIQNDIHFYEWGRNGERISDHYETADIYTDYTIPANFKLNEALIDFDNYYDYSFEKRPESIKDLCFIYNFNTAQYDQLSDDDFYDAMWYRVDTTKHLSDLGEIRIRIERDPSMDTRDKHIQFKQNDIVVKGVYND